MTADPVRRLRLDGDPERAEKGLAALVLTIVELLRQLMGAPGPAPGGGRLPVR
jgi:hypothetical protein